MTAPRPVGIFVHHQGRGHVQRAGALAQALLPERQVTLFSADPQAVPAAAIAAGARVIALPSLFQPTGAEAPAMQTEPAPRTVHCAPLGWPGIRTAMARIAGWFAAADPALMIADVSAEVAQLARLCSVPHVKVLQHGTRTDPAHRAAYDGAVGLLAPCHRTLAQPEWAEWADRIHYAPGLGVAPPGADRAAARMALGLDPDRRLIAVISGAGAGEAGSSASVAVGARALPDALWVTIGPLARDWHATDPGNLRHLGWTDQAADWLAAADLVVSSAGNSVTHEMLALGTPWIVIPQWCYFDEQSRKAQALAAAGVAHAPGGWPASAEAWDAAMAAALAGHDAARSRALYDPGAAEDAAAWIESLIARLWAGAPAAPRTS